MSESTLVPDWGTVFEYDEADAIAEAMFTDTDTEGS